MIVTHALSFSQPWLWAMTRLPPDQLKRCENRSFRPPQHIVGKRIAMHAAMSWDQSAPDFIERLTGTKVPERKRNAVDENFMPGHIVATGVIEDFFAQGDILFHPEMKSKWFFGEYGWVFGDVRLLAQPIPAKGMLGVWELKSRGVAPLEVP